MQLWDIKLANNPLTWISWLLENLFSLTTGITVLIHYAVSALLLMAIIISVHEQLILQ